MGEIEGSLSPAAVSFATESFQSQIDASTINFHSASSGSCLARSEKKKEKKEIKLFLQCKGNGKGRRTTRVGVEAQSGSSHFLLSHLALKCDAFKREALTNVSRG